MVTNERQGRVYDFSKLAVIDLAPSNNGVGQFPKIVAPTLHQNARVQHRWRSQTPETQRATTSEAPASGPRFRHWPATSRRCPTALAANLEIS